MGVKVMLKGYKEVIEHLEKQKVGAQKTIEYTVKDFRGKMPGWIATEVVKEYNIGKKTITSGKVGTVTVTGNGMDSAIVFEGRVLTPLHFGMKPRKMKRPKKVSKKDRIKIPGDGITFKGKGGPVATLGKVQKPYTVSWTIKRGQTTTAKGKYGTPWFIAPAAKGSETQIAFQRSPGHPKGWDTVAAKTVSVPQMVSHDGSTLKPEIAAEVWPKLEKRLDHHMKRYMGQ